MALTMEAPSTLEGPEDVAPESQPATEVISVDEANAELNDVGRETQNEIGQADADAQANEQTSQTADIDDDEKRFWATIAIKAKLADCGRDIRSAESKIDHLKMLIKEEKEFLKGEQIRLTRLAGDLADIIDGHPLPKDPNAKPENDKSPEQTTGPDSETTEAADNSPNWRVMETGALMDGLKGLGAKKLEALVDMAPTAGDLEDLRGEASRAHMAFKEKLPSGFGQKIADAIEDRLIEHVAKCAPSAEEQAAAERDAAQFIQSERNAIAETFSKSDEGTGEDQPDEPNPIAGKIEQREREQLQTAEDPPAEEYEDVADDEVL